MITRRWVYRRYSCVRLASSAMSRPRTTKEVSALDEKPSVRRLKVFALLATARYPKSRKELSALVSRSRKTVARDVDDLSTSLGFHIVEEVRRNGERYYSIDPANPLPEWLRRALSSSPCSCGRHRPSRSTR